MGTLGIALVTLALAIVLLALGRVSRPEWSISPDGRRYLALAAGRPVPLPFALRWLLPRLCSTSLLRWRWCTAAHMVALPPLVAVWLTGWIGDGRACVAGGLLVCGLPGVWRIHLRWPVLVDPAAMAWAVASAVAARERWWVAAAVLALVAGCIKETAPVFAACYAYHPLALVGLLAPALRALTAPRGDDPENDPEILDHPFRSSRRAHRGRWLDPRLMLAPWGLCLLAPAAAEPRLLAVLALTAAVAYGQLLVAVDTVRLYQWAAPPAILATMTVVPPRLAVLGLLLHLANPWAGDGL